MSTLLLFVDVNTSLVAGTDPLFDVVTVFHCERNYRQTLELEETLRAFDLEARFVFWGVDNRTINRGFAKACNLGAREGTAPLIAFLNPDLVPEGPILGPLVELFENDDRLVIAGERFGNDTYWEGWGCRDWVCGALMVVRRDWFELTGGFCEDYVWGFEETDLVRRAQQQRYKVRSVVLPVKHLSGVDDTKTDQAYKRQHMGEGGRVFRSRWMGAS